jgi:hypothetical protein
MRRICSHIPLIAALAAVCLAGQTLAIGTAVAATSPPVDKAAINKAVQEALAKAQAEKGGASGQSAAGTESTGGSAGGSSESFSKLTQGGGEEETTTPTTATTSTASSSGVSTSVLVPVFILGGLLIAGIAFYIVRDARGVAPAGDGLGSAGSVQERAARQRKRRAKAKAARRQRKRNR